MFYHDVLDERAGIKEMDDNSTVVTYSGNGTANMTIPIKRSEMNYLNYEAPDNVEWLWSITVAIFVLFGMIGAFASGAWADYFGRFVHFSFCFHSTCREVAWYLRLVMVFANLCWVFGSIFFFRKRGMILITFIMFVAAIFGGIPKVTRSFEVLIVHRALAGLHCGMFLLASNLSMVNNIGTIHAHAILLMHVLLNHL